MATWRGSFLGEGPWSWVVLILRGSYFIFQTLPPKPGDSQVPVAATSPGDGMPAASHSSLPLSTAHHH